MDFANILVGSDGSSLMEAVFDECVYLAQLTGATIHVAYVLDITGFGAQPIDASWEETYVIIKAEARRILDAAKEALKKRGWPKPQSSTFCLRGTRPKNLMRMRGATRLTSSSSERTAEKA
jgi:nucleotide-binding universal stress UspA family protein